MITESEMKRRRGVVILNWRENCDKNIAITVLAKQCKVTPETYRKYLREVGINPVGRIFTYKCDRGYFKEIDTEEKAYWLGFLYADGSVSINSGVSYIMSLTIAIKDSEHLFKFKKALNCNIPERSVTAVNPYNIEDIRDLVRLDISSKEMCNDLICHGCVPSKSLIKEFPIGVPKLLFRHFLRGYFDGNGFITETDKTPLQLGFTSSLPFINHLEEHLKSTLGIKKFTKTIYQSKNHLEWSTLRKAGIDALNILNYLYEDSTIYLNRKYNKWVMSTINLGKTKKANS